MIAEHSSRSTGASRFARAHTSVSSTVGYSSVSWLRKSAMRRAFVIDLKASGARRESADTASPMLMNSRSERINRSCLYLSSSTSRNAPAIALRASTMSDKYASASRGVERLPGARYVGCDVAILDRIHHHEIDIDAWQTSQFIEQVEVGVERFAASRIPNTSKRNTPWRAHAAAICLRLYSGIPTMIDLQPHRIWVRSTMTRLSNRPPMTPGPWRRPSLRAATA